MATNISNVNINLTTLSLEDNAINKFAKLINTRKSEIITSFRQLHDLLDTKQTSLINELDNLLTDFSTYIQTNDYQVRLLRKARQQVQVELTHNKLNTVLECTLKQLQDSIDKLDTLVIPTVDIRWDTSNYSTVINNICKVELLSYSNRTQPIWSTVSKGKGHNQLYTPEGIAVDQDSGNIYVTDSIAHRIQIYNSVGEYDKTINTENYYPSRLLLDTEYCYVSSIYSFSNNIIKINKLSGDIVDSRVSNNNIAGMCLDVLDINSIFMCVFNSSIVLVYNKSDIIQTNSIQLNTQYYTNKTSPFYTIKMNPSDIKLLPTELIILFTHTDYPLQCFNREGVLLRAIISKQQIKCGYYFCTDMYNNYIISDYNDDNIKIFTPSGKLITSIGKIGQKIGQFKYPQGICLDLNNRIIICDWKDNYRLQAF